MILTGSLSKSDYFTIGEPLRVAALIAAFILAGATYGRVYVRISRSHSLFQDAAIVLAVLSILLEFCQ